MNQGLGACQAGFSEIMVDEWVRAGITDVVLSPGSRSTPVVLAIFRSRKLKRHVVLDERCAGFVALGIAKATGRPVVVVTTSGTAATELHSAIVEADASGVPLIAVTTDRPSHLQDVGSAQTIDQVGLFSKAVRFATTIEPNSDDNASMWRSLASRVVVEAIAGSCPGPVHLNLRFDEPLVAQPSGIDASLAAGRPGGAPWHQVIGNPTKQPNPEAIDRLGSFAGGKVLLVVGEGCGDPEAIAALGMTLGWPMIAESRSGARIPGVTALGAADCLLRSEKIRSWTPEAIVRVGGPLTSSVVERWIASLPTSTAHIVIDETNRWLDPTRSGSEFLSATASVVAKAVCERVAGFRASGWLRQWGKAEAIAQVAIDEYFASQGSQISEPAILRSIYGTISDDATLFVGSSMPIRDLENYSVPRKGVSVLSNRGANGIDGTIASAIGASLAKGPQVPTYCVIGDLAFLYDVGALIGAQERSINLTLVVIDNDGGGIFSFLPVANSVGSEMFEKAWGTPHGLDLSQIAASFGVQVESASNLSELKSALIPPASNPSLRMICLKTDRARNVEVHEELERAVTLAVEKEL